MTGFVLDMFSKPEPEPEPEPKLPPKPELPPLPVHLAGSKYGIRNQVYE